MTQARRQHRAPRCRVKPASAPRWAALRAQLEATTEPMTLERMAALQHALAQPRAKPAQGELELPA